MPHHHPFWHQLVDDYFSFSRSQRRVMLFLLSATIAVLLLVKAGQGGLLTDDENGSFSDEILASLMVRDSGMTFSRFNSDPAYPFSEGRSGTAAPSAGRLFYFDPNTASLQDLLALGLRERTAQNLLNYRSKGGKFRKPEDLSKLYSLRPEEAQRLIPYVRIGQKEDAIVKDERSDEEGSTPVPAPEVSRKPTPVVGPIDINLADSVLLQLLPGVGAKRASSIIRYRDRLGGFTHVEQVAETPALPDSVFEKIRSSLVVGGQGMKPLHLNKATENELKAHPYIGWQWAKLIVAYRNQHGAFKSVDDLLKIHVVKNDWLEKVRPYLTVE
ncbi:MAG TPA: helix-hairpin-helix domain-containing protein [Phnomibacter sp.]|nr:helix-hairpin-helix domain-containing protein [Phnomibacter sp.]